VEKTTETTVLKCLSVKRWVCPRWLVTIMVMFCAVRRSVSPLVPYAPARKYPGG
jgi:hypothetical protein